MSHFSGDNGRDIVGGTRDFEQAMNELGLNYTVSKRDIYFDCADGIGVAPNHCLAVRDDNDMPFGPVGKDFGMIQPMDAFSPAKEWLSLDPTVSVVSGGALDGGRTAWLHLELPVKGEPVPGDIVRYLAQFHCGFDGSAANTLRVMALREACINHSIVAHVRNAFKIKHTKNAQSRFDAMRHDMQVAIEAAVRHVELLNGLAKVYVSDSELLAFANDLFPAEGQETARTRILDLAHTGKGQDLNGLSGTAWAAYNAVTEYSEYWRGTEGRGRKSTQESRWQNVTLGGTGDELNQQAFQYLVNLAA